ncbi:MAG: DNA polymerase IV [Candidatus Omnitrophica bacterium]|nr:DNA polymerase IV [Candidatus Omnitrophota bacterium]
MEANKVIAHIDMDAFFAAVEQRDRPELKGKPVVIGADPQKGKGRGVVSTCSYEARPYGIHSAQPISMAYQKCPHAVFLPPSFSKYKKVSLQIRDIFHQFTPNVEPISVDEAFLDLTGCFHFYHSPAGAGREIKRRIYEATGLTASVGIAPIKNVAKIASDLCKPDGLLEVKLDGLMDFLKPLKVEKLWGVGPKAKTALNKMAIITVGDLMKIPKATLIGRFGDYGLHLYNLSHGIDPRDVCDSDEVKSVSHEHTFSVDTCDIAEVHRIMLILSEKISRRLRKLDLKGRTIGVKIRLKGFTTYTRAISLENGTNFADDIYSQSRLIFDKFYKKGQRIRLIGIRLSNFKEHYIQESLFPDVQKKRKEDIHKAIDAIKDKFGEKAIHRGL